MDLKTNREEVKYFIKYEKSSAKAFNIQIKNAISKYGINDILAVFDEEQMKYEDIWKNIDPLYHRIVFSSNELSYDILDNPMVPKHDIIKSDNNIIDQDKYPTILSCDPVIRRINAKLGDIIRITRKKGYHYRIVRYL
jgi:DNA-directed RNA polymerase subunit H (RpoH/RPB5)